MLVRADFQTLLAAAAVGERIIYHTGDLQFQRQKGSQLDATAEAVWQAHLRGDCTMVQRRVSPYVWEYIAVKSARPPEYKGCYEPNNLAGTRMIPGLPRHRTRFRERVTDAVTLAA